MSWICLLAGISCAAMAQAEPISGHAEAIDGDTIVIAHQHIRLQGLDAEELDEPHGPEARGAMQAIVSGQTVTCNPDGTRSYNRIVARCFVGRIDIAIPMVAAGWALDCPRYSNGRYRKFEADGAREHLIQKPYCK